MTPAMAVAAATSTLARWVRTPLPCLPSKLRLVVDTMRSCGLPLREVKADQKIVTIEGLSPDVSHPIQKAWLDLDVPQCGYCQSGMLMAATALLARKPRPTDADIDAAITNLCRCGTYPRIKSAIKAAAKL